MHYRKSKEECPPLHLVHLYNTRGFIFPILKPSRTILIGLEEFSSQTPLRRLEINGGDYSAIYKGYEDRPLNKACSMSVNNLKRISETLKGVNRRQADKIQTNI